MFKRAISTYLLLAIPVRRFYETAGTPSCNEAILTARALMALTQKLFLLVTGYTGPTDPFFELLVAHE